MPSSPAEPPPKAPSVQGAKARETKKAREEKVDIWIGGALCGNDRFLFVSCFVQVLKKATNATTGVEEKMRQHHRYGKGKMIVLKASKHVASKILDSIGYVIDHGNLPWRHHGVI